MRRSFSLWRPAAPADPFPGLRHHVLQGHPGTPRIGIGGQRKLLGNDFADIEQISGQGLRRVGLGAQDRLAALGIPLILGVLAEDDAKSLVEVLGHGFQGQDAGLNDLAAQTAFDDHLTARPAIDRHTG